MGVEFVGVQRAFSAPEATRAYADGEFTWHVVKPEGGGPPGPRCNNYDKENDRKSSRSWS